MIASIEGIIIEKNDDNLVINVGGMGFRVMVSPRTCAKQEIHKRVGFNTYLVVREESLTLFGFETPEERDMFMMLLSVSGVGPRTAMAVISSIPLENIRTAVITEKPEMFNGVQGVGKKTAQSIILNLHGKIHGEPGETIRGTSDIDNDVIGALTSLGYSIVESQAAIQMIPDGTPDDLETRIRIALKYFS